MRELPGCFFSPMCLGIATVVLLAGCWEISYEPIVDADRDAQVDDDQGADDRGVDDGDAAGDLADLEDPGDTASDSETDSADTDTADAAEDTIADSADIPVEGDLDADLAGDLPIQEDIADVAVDAPPEVDVLDVAGDPDASVDPIEDVADSGADADAVADPDVVDEPDGGGPPAPHAVIETGPTEQELAVAVSGDVVVVGRPTDELVEAYDMTVTPDTPDGQIVPPNFPPSGAPPTSYGISVAIAGDVAAVGAVGVPQLTGPGGTPTTDSGEVFWFEHTTTWEIQGPIAPYEVEGDNSFGLVLDTTETYLVTGSEVDDRIRFFDLTAGTRPDLETVLTYATPDFPAVVAISDETVVAGAPGADNSQGMVYVFQRDLATAEWSEVDALVAPVRQNDNLFGSAVDVYVAGPGARVVVGEPGAGASHEAGLVHVFQENESDFAHLGLIEEPSPAVLGFGRAVSIHLNRVAVASNDAVYLYTCPAPDAVPWECESAGPPYVSPGSDDDFGGRIALNESWLVVTAHAAETVYVFDAAP